MRESARNVLVLFLLLVSHTAVASPAGTVETYHERLLQAVRADTAASDASRFEKLAPAMDDAFDFEGMIKTAAGRHWAQASPAAQENLVAAFRRVSIATYADQFGGMTNGHFVIKGTRDGPRGLKLVESQLSTRDDNVTLTYVVRDKGSKWRIIDVLLKGGISELALRASEYAGTLEKGGAEALIKVLNKQAASLLKK